MIKEAIRMQKQKRFIVQAGITFLFFIAIYTILDYLNGGYIAMIETYSIFLVVLNIILNIVMSAISTIMLNLSSALVLLAGKEGKGSFMSMVAVLFGMLTYGCTPCVIGFFAIIGITFSVAALPLAGLPYKLMALALLLIGGVWLLYEMNKAKCKININIKENKNES